MPCLADCWADLKSNFFFLRGEGGGGGDVGGMGRGLSGVWLMCVQPAYDGVSESVCEICG